MQKRRLLLTLAALTAATLALPALAGPDNPPRPFPPNTKRGKMTPGYYPDITINGKPRQLSPASRILNDENLIAAPASLRGSDIIINYTEDRDGNIDKVWILTREEAGMRLPPAVKID